MTIGLDDITIFIGSSHQPDEVGSCIESIRKLYDVPIVVFDQSIGNTEIQDRLKQIKNNFKNTRVLFAEKEYGYGVGVDFCLSKICKTKYALCLEATVTITGSIFEYLISEINNRTFYAAGDKVNVNYSGVVENCGKIPYIRSYCFLINIDEYKKYDPFFHHGAPCLSAMVDIYNKNDCDKLLNIDLSEYISRVEVKSNNASKWDELPAFNFTKTNLAISTYFSKDYNPLRLEIFKSSMRSLLHTDYDGQIFVVDDGSMCKDHLAWLSDKFKAGKKVTIIEKPVNGGIAKTKNTCIRLLMESGEYGFLADDDVLYRNNFQRAYLKPMLSSGVTHFCKYIMNDKKKVITHNGVDILRTELLNGIFLTISREQINKVGYFPVLPYKYGHEHVNFTIRSIRAGFSPYFCDIVDSDKYINIIPESGNVPSIPDLDWSKVDQNQPIAFRDMSYRKCVE